MRAILRCYHRQALRPKYRPHALRDRVMCHLHQSFPVSLAHWRHNVPVSLSFMSFSGCRAARGVTRYLCVCLILPAACHRQIGVPFLGRYLAKGFVLWRDGRL